MRWPPYEAKNVNSVIENKVRRTMEIKLKGTHNYLQSVDGTLDAAKQMKSNRTCHHSSRKKHTYRPFWVRWSDDKWH